VEEGRAEGIAVLAFPPHLRRLVEKVAIPCNGKSPIEAALELWEMGLDVLREQGLELGHGKSVGLGTGRITFEEL
jgi:hypothetical protein